MSIGRAVAWTLALTIAVGGCGDGDEPPEMVPEEEEPLQTRDVSPSTAPDTAAPGPADTAERARREAEGESADIPPGQTLYTVQIGAFTEDENATRLAERLEGTGLPVWNPDAQVAGRDYRRIRVGATSDLSEARRLGQMLEDRFGFSYWIAPVSAGESMPAGVIDETGSLLRGR